MIHLRADISGKQITGLGGEPRTGDFVNFTVLRRLDSHSYRIRLSGMALTVKSRIPLEPGQTLRGQVFLEGRSLNIKVIQENPFSAGSFLTSQGGPPVPGTLSSGALSPAALALRSLFLSNLPLGPEFQKKITAMTGGKNDRPEAFRSRLAALLLEKGLELPRQAFQVLTGLLGAPSGPAEPAVPHGPDLPGGSDSSDGSGGEKHPGSGPNDSSPHDSSPNDSGPHGGHDSPHGSPSDGPGEEGNNPPELSREAGTPDWPPEGPSPAVVLGQLKDQCRGAEDFNSLHLFNHISGPENHWILLPYKVSLGGHEKTGWISAKINRAGGKIESAFLRCRGDWGVWDFHFPAFRENSPEKVRFQVPQGPDHPEKERIQRELTEKLHNIGLKTADNEEEGVFDGFGSQGPFEISGVERYI